MNIMIAAVNVDPGFAALRGTGGGAAFVTTFAAIGLLLLAVAACVLRGCREQPHAVRYSIPRH